MRENNADITLLCGVTNSELSMAPGRTLDTILFTTDSDISAVEVIVVVVDRPSDMSSDALIITPLDAGDDRGAGGPVVE